jgi:hypothetical protein
MFEHIYLIFKNALALFLKKNIISIFWNKFLYSAIDTILNKCLIYQLIQKYDINY